MSAARVGRTGPPRRLPLLAGAAILLTSACSPPTTAGAPSQPPAQRASSTAASNAVTDRVVNRIVTMTTQDGTRTAIVHHPASAGTGAPLIVVLHPAASAAAQMQSSFGWDAVAELNHLVVVYPEGLLDGQQDTWNGGACCAPANELGTNDVGFLSSLVTALRTTDQIGKNIYAVGYSNGAFLAYSWACSSQTLLSGLGVVAGALLTPCPTPRPLPVVIVHGTTDPSVPIGGRPTGRSSFAIPALSQSTAPFRTAAHCPERPSIDTATVTTWNCPEGRRIVTDIITGLDHSWPGAGATAGSSTEPSDATGFIWSNLSNR